MLVLRMIRNALSTLFLVVALGMMALRLAPLYLSPESNTRLQDAVAQTVATVTGRPELATPRGPDPNDILGRSQDDLMRQLGEIRERLAPAQTLPEGQPLPAPSQPRFQPSARPAYGLTAPRTTGPKVIRVGE